MQKKNKNSIVANSVFFAMYKLLNVVFPLITSVYVARVLLPEGTGRVAYAQNIVTYFTLLAALGLPTYGTREIARTVDHPDEYHRTFFELLTINGISTLLCVAGYYTLCLTVPSFRSDLSLYLVAGLSIVLNFFNVDWLYQGREEYKYISVRGAVIKAASIILLFLVVRTKSDYIKYAAIHCFVLGGNNIINMLGLRKRIRFSRMRLNIRRHLKPILILFATNLAIELYTLLDTTMLGAMCEKSIVGYYAYAMKTSKIVITILAAVTAVLLPKLSLYHANGEKDKYRELANTGFLFVMLASVPCAIILSLNADHIIPFLYGAEYVYAVDTYRILSMLLIPISFSTYLGVQILCSSGKEAKMLIAVSAGAVINIVLNSILIPRYQHNGAAVASILSEIAVAVLDFIFVRQTLRFSVSRKLWITFAVGLAAGIASVLLIRALLQQHMVLSLLLSSLAGLAVYGVINCRALKQIVRVKG